jgi:hypothetical protein
MDGSGLSNPSVAARSCAEGADVSSVLIDTPRLNPPTAAEPSAAQPKAESYRYWAFISYSHKDSDRAAKIHRRLETWRVPKNLVGRVTSAGAIPRRLFPIFRDRDELSGGENLDEVLKAALKQSRYLIVLCSPSAAASRYVEDEIRFFKALGRDARIIYVILSGDPSVEDPTAAGACFPLVVRQRVGSDGQLMPGRVEPMAADLRPGKDGVRDGLLKVQARLLDVPFDELKQREGRRRRRARAFIAALACGVAALMGTAYVGVADAGLSVPGGNAIRARLDRHEASVFRHVADDATVRTAAAKISRELRTSLRSRFTKDGLINDSPPNESPSIAYIAHAQSLAALLARGNAAAPGPTQLAAVVDRFETLFRPELLAKTKDGVNVGWINDAVARDVDSFTPLWTAVAICEALQCPEARTDRAARARLLEMLAYAQEGMRPFRHDDVPGAWDAFPFQTDVRRHSVYSSTLALLALCEARRADVGWEGSASTRDQLARQTADWLISQYRSAGNRHGWLNDPFEEHAADIFDGLTAQTYSALLDAQATFPGIAVPVSMLDDIRVYLSEGIQRSVDYSIDVGEFRMEYRRLDGTVGPVKETLRYLWWPWFIRTGDLWLRHAAGRGDIPNEHRVEVRRALAHLILDLGPAQRDLARNGYSYINSENLFGLRGLSQE